MKTLYRFQKGKIELKFFPEINEGIDYLGNIKMGGNQCRIYVPEDWSMKNIHPDVLALIIILIVYPFAYKKIEVPLGVSQTFHDVFKRETNKFIYPIDKNLKPRTAPQNAVPGLAYSAGVDSTAALTLMPNNTVCFFLDRIIPKTLAEKTKLYDKKSVYNVYSQLEKQGRKGYIVKTDLEYIRSPKGFPVELATTIPGLILADYVGIDSMATGAIMEHQLIPYHKLSVDRDYYVKWHNIFSLTDIKLNLVTAGISEVGTMKIVINSPYYAYNHWCSKGIDSTPCLKCEKCFRKKLLEMILLEQNISDLLLNNFFLSNEVRTTLKLLPIPCENVIAYISSRYNGNHKMLESLRVRTRGDILDTSWMEKWYEPSKNLIDDKYYSYIKKEIDKYLDTMNESDELNMKYWDVMEIRRSSSYKEAHKDFISDLIDFKKSFKNKGGNPNQ